LETIQFTTDNYKELTIKVKELIPEIGRLRLQLYLRRPLLFLFGGELLYNKNLLRGLPMCIDNGLIEEFSILLLLP